MGLIRAALQNQSEIINNITYTYDLSANYNLNNNTPSEINVNIINELVTRNHIRDLYLRIIGSTETIDD